MSELFTFADELEWTTPQLTRRLVHLTEQEKQGYLTEERLRQIGREASFIVFELSERNDHE